LRNRPDETILLVVLGPEDSGPILSFFDGAPAESFRVGGERFDRLPNGVRVLDGFHHWLWSEPDELAGVRFLTEEASTAAYLIAECARLDFVVLLDDSYGIPLRALDILFQGEERVPLRVKVGDLAGGAEHHVFRSAEGTWAVALDATDLSPQARASLRASRRFVENIALE